MPDKPWLPSNWASRELDPVFRGFRTQLDTLFEDWFGRSIGGALAPRVDVSETANEVTLTVELPGVAEKDIDVSLSGNQLTIKGEKKSEHQEKEDSDDGRVFHRVERTFGAFQRTMTIPFDVEPDKVSAGFKDGVLTITLPKPAGTSEQPQKRRIEVKRSV
ncbi:MAG: Hsp20/alpha crystallin family protein [Hyphomicrobiaceae bacterium]|nr:Hsp20/alpha crystallin family protein [Hyphomicrobiaceae bacterium]